MKGILWDLDGTLLNTLTDLAASVNFALRSLGFPERTVEEVRRFVGNGAARLITLALPEEGKAHFDEAFELFREHYAHHSDDATCPYEGIPELLERLKKKGYTMGIVSNKPDFAVKDLARLYFPAVAVAAGEKAGVPRKPNPDGLYLAMEGMGVKKEDCIYIGDSEVDVATAKNTGIPCIAVTWGFRSEETLREAGAVHFAHTAEELIAKISELLP
ncbi:MAG: HAD-IA family hydrolase [Clostridia bacterium]|nr:HAD-IA family hydrolase [Clostridia bacterium]